MHVLRGLLLLLAIGGVSFAQSIFATVVGTVADSSSAVIPGAKVRVTNVGTNERREFTTNQSGLYEINNLFPGAYVLEVEMTGFARYRREQISLAANENARIDVTLEVVTQATEVTVSAAGAARIETESALLADVRSLKQLQSLPLADRSIYRYLVLTPGVTGGMNGTMSVSGSRSRQVHYAVDGVTMSDVRSSNTIGPTLNFIESFEEAKIDFGNNTAEFKALGTLTIASKRGGNQIHGAVYDYYSTGAFRARDYFTGGRSGTPNHGFGGHISGPVYLPKLYDGRDKTFWLLSYETTFAPQAVTNLTPTVPLVPWKQGDFSRETTILRDPFAGNTPFAGNVIPQTRISNVARQYMPYWPDPNFGNTSAFANQNYREAKRRPFSKPHNGQVRIDHRISKANTIFGRYLHQRQTNPEYDSGLPGIGLRRQVRVVKHALISDTHIFSPTLINEFRWGVSYNTNPIWNAFVNGPAFIQAAGLTNVTRDGTIPDVRQIPVVRFAQGPGITSIAVNNERFYNEDLTTQWQDTISKITGKHSLRFGIEINQRRFRDQNQNQDLFGNYQFTNRYTGFNFADFLLGLPSALNRAPFAEQRIDKSIAYDFFIQDNYKITNSLTLNLGLRYEFHPSWTTSGDRISAFDAQSGSIVVPDSALPLVSDLFPRNLVPVIGHSQTQFNDRLFRADRNNLAPRVGFAWRPFGAKSFVVRSGYGIFYDIIPRQPTLFGTPFVVNEPAYTNPTDVSDPGFVQWPLAYPRVVQGAGVSIPGWFENGFKTPYAQNWNFTLEKEIVGMAARASYVGTGGRQMSYPHNINQPLPGPGAYVDKPRPFPTLPAITEQRNGASHTYHALSLELERRYSNGLMFQTFFTFAKDLGDEELTTLENTFDRSRERSQTQITPYRRWTGFFIYELPVGKGKRFGSSWRGPAGHLLGGWELSASATLQDGQNETPLWQAADIHGIAHTTTRTPPLVARRPDCLGDPNFPSGRQSISAWYDVSAFRLPATPGVFGTCGRGIIHGPAVRVLHAGLFKNFRIAERATVRIGSQVTNVLNHPNWSNLSMAALSLDNTSARARVDGANGATGTSAGDAAGARVLRLDMRIDF